MFFRKGTFGIFFQNVLIMIMKGKFVNKGNRRSKFDHVWCTGIFFSCQSSECSL